MTAPTILIVDDSQENRDLLRIFLESNGLSVDEAEDGAAALARVCASRYDLVLMDVHMPGMDGLAATRAIRDAEASTGARRTIILALTADDTEADRARSLAAGCDEHLTKPVRKKPLVATVQRWLERGQR